MINIDNVMIYYYMINCTEPSFHDLVQHRFCRDSKLQILQDVYDGRVYMMHEGFFKCKHNISLNLNYDGAPKFKSSGMQVWPIQFIINELPPNVRYVHFLYS